MGVQLNGKKIPYGRGLRSERMDGLMTRMSLPRNGTFFLTLAIVTAQAWLLPASSRASIPKLAQGRAEEVRIRVRLAEAIPMVAVGGFDLRLPGAPTQLASTRAALDGKTDWEFRCQDERIRAVRVRGGASFDLPSPARIVSPTGLR
jgi:hypothetical protein